MRADGQQQSVEAHHATAFRVEDVAIGFEARECVPPVAGAVLLRELREVDPGGMREPEGSATASGR